MILKIFRIVRAIFILIVITRLLYLEPSKAAAFLEVLAGIAILAPDPVRGKELLDNLDD
jgi:hypothetical protein